MADRETVELAEEAAALVLDRECVLRAHELAEGAARRHAAFAKLAAVLHTWRTELQRSVASEVGPLATAGED